MNTRLIICLHRGSSLISRLIGWQTRSAYSHASMLLPDGLFIEAREGKGVRAYRHLGATKDEVVDLFTLDLTPSQAVEVADFARNQIGKDYDWTMVLRFITRRQESRSSSGKWFCSELVYASLQYAGVELLRDTQPWEVSPGLLAKSPLLKPYVFDIQHPEMIAV